MLDDVKVLRLPVQRDHLTRLVPGLVGIDDQFDGRWSGIDVVNADRLGHWNLGQLLAGADKAHAVIAIRGRLEPEVRLRLTEEACLLPFEAVVVRIPNANARN